jgi:hypothetical protein
MIYRTAGSQVLGEVVELKDSLPAALPVPSSKPAKKEPFQRKSLK